MSADLECVSHNGNSTMGSNLETKARDLMLKGRSLNLEDSFNQEAFDMLSKAIKLNPHLIQAWVELTKCYQKMKDIDGAIACLENALKYCDTEKPNKIILRKLSTCIRQKTYKTQEAEIAALLRSLDLSKQALKSDLYDEENYYNLAKAYMVLFFATECVDRQLINLSKAAYIKALSLSTESEAKKEIKQDDERATELEKSKLDQSDIQCDLDERSKSFYKQSDFLFNFGTVLVYLQEFQKALDYLRLAIKLDPSWREPKTLEECLVDYLRQIELMTSGLSKNSKKVVRRYGKIVETLKSVDKIETIIQADQQRLRRSLDIRVKSFTLDEIEASTNFCQKAESENDSQMPSNESNTTKVIDLVHLKLLSIVNYNQAMYLTFIAIDKEYSMSVVTIYNLAASRCPTSKDIVTIVSPRLEQVTVNNLDPNKQSSEISFKNINVREFKDMYVNGFRITMDQVSKPQFVVSVLP